MPRDAARHRCVLIGGLRSLACLALLVACRDKQPTPTPTPTATPTVPTPVVPADGRKMTVVVEQCLPVGYGYRCAGTVGGRGVSIQACVGRDAIDGLTHRLESAPIAGQDGGAPVTLALDTKYVGVLDAAYSTDYCGGLFFADSKDSSTSSTSCREWSRT